MSNRLWTSVTVGNFLMVVLLTVRCSESAIPVSKRVSTATTAPTATPVLVGTTVPTTTMASEPDEGAGHAPEPHPVARGQQVYLSVGCGVCHGEDAMGTDIASGLPGHSELQIRRQARESIGIMPVFGQASLESDELDDLVAYVLSLEGEHMHGSGSGSLGAAESMSLMSRMAVIALDSGELVEVTHHVTHLVDLLEGPHHTAVEEALAAFESDELNTGQHLIGSMLVDVAVPAETLPQLHLMLALSAVRVEGTESATRHLDHVAEQVSDHESEAIGQAHDLIAGAEFVLAEELIAGKLGVEAHGTEDADALPDIDPALTPVHEAYEADQAGDAAMTAHHIEQFIEQASGMDRVKAREVLELLEKTDLHEVEDAIGALVGISANAG